MHYDVACIPQETTNTCWAAAMAMLLQHLAGGSSSSTSPFAPRFTPRHVAEQTGGVILAAYNQDRLLSTDFQQNFRDLAHPWCLDTEFDFRNVDANGWEQRLTRLGPIFVLRNVDGLIDHAVIVSGVDPGQDQLTIVDPWPVGQGSRYPIPVTDIHLAGTAIHRGRDTLLLGLQPGRSGS